MAKTAEKQVKKNANPMCTCGQEMKWARYANRRVMCLYCESCQKLFDRKGREFKND